MEVSGELVVGGDRSIGPLSDEPVAPALRLPPWDRGTTAVNVATSLAVGVVIGSSSILLLGGPLTALVSLIALPIFYVAAHRWNRRAAAAFDELERGRFEPAEAVYRAMTRKKPGLVRSLGVANLGYLAYRQGHFATAIALYSEFLRSGIPYRDNAASNLALCYALTGRLDAARAWLPPADARGIFVPTAFAIVQCFEGSFAEVASIKPRRLGSTARRLVRHERRLLELVRALAMTRLDDPEGAAKALVAAHPSFDGEYDYLAAQWPMIRELLVQQAWLR